MTIDQAIGEMYIAIDKTRDDRGQYVKCLQALQTLYLAAAAIEKSQQVLTLLMQNEFDKEIHSMALYTSVLNNAKLLKP